MRQSYARTRFNVKPVARIGGQRIVRSPHERSDMRGDPDVARKRAHPGYNSGHRRPGSIRVAASISTRHLWPSIDVDRVSVGTALQPIGFVCFSWDDRAVPAGVRIFPGNRRSSAPVLQGLHLRRIGAPLVFIVHCGPYPIADEPTNRGPRKARRNALAGSATKLRADKPSG